MLKLKNISKIFGIKTVLNDISLTFGDRGLCFLTGESGVGKSTLLNIISLLEEPNGGEIIYNGLNLLKLPSGNKDKIRGNLFAFIFQEFNLIEDLTVEQNLALCLNPNQEDKIDEVLLRLDILNFKTQKVSVLSGGERQRVTLARALLKDVPVIIADEPTANLDGENARLVMELLKDASKDRLVIVASHNNELINIFADRIISLKDGKVFSDSIINNSVDNKKAFRETTNKNSFSFKEKIEFILNDFKKNKGRFFRLAFIMLFSISLFSIAVSMFLSNDNEIIRHTISRNDQKFIQTTANSSNIIKMYDCDSGFDSEELFYDININKIAFIDDNDAKLFELLKGNYPLDDCDVIISDYLAKSLSLSKGFELESLIGKTIKQLGLDFKITGVFKTNYNQFVNNKNDLFKEAKNNYYSVIFTTKKTFEKINQNIYVTAISIKNSSYGMTDIIRLRQSENNQPLCGEKIQTPNQAYISLTYAKFLCGNPSDINQNPQYYFEKIDKTIELRNGTVLQVVGIYDDSNIEIGFRPALITNQPILQYSSQLNNYLHIDSKDFYFKNIVTNTYIYEDYLTFYRQAKIYFLIAAISLLIICFMLNLNYSNMKIEQYLCSIGVWRCVGITKSSILSLFLNDNLFFALFVCLIFTLVITPLMAVFNTVKAFGVYYCVYRYGIFNYFLILAVSFSVIIFSGIMPILKLSKFSAVEVVRNQIKRIRGKNNVKAD